MLRAIAFGLVGYLTGDVVGDAKDAFTLSDCPRADADYRL
jgi:hypothetical protein